MKMVTLATLVVLIGLVSGASSTPSMQSGKFESYAAAFRHAQQLKRPLIVLVGADWCPACKRLEREAVPYLQEEGVLRQAVLAVVNYDQETKIAQELTRGGPIPQLFVFLPSEDGWKGQKIVGYRPREAVLEFVTETIKNGVSSDRSENGKTNPARSAMNSSPRLTPSGQADS